MATFIVNDLDDPHVMKIKFPNIHVLNDSLKSNVEIDHYVKLRRDGEYFWVHIKEIDGTKLTGEIYYQLSFNTKFTIGDFIIFERCYIFDIYDAMIFNQYPRMDQIEVGE